MRCIREDCNRSADELERMQGLYMAIKVEIHPEVTRDAYMCPTCVRKTIKEYIIAKLEGDPWF